MGYRVDIDGTRFVFASLKELLAKASPERTGDQLACLAAEGPPERLAAQSCLADVPLTAFLDDVLQVEGDAVTDLIVAQHDPEAFRTVASLTVGEFRDWLLRPETTGASLAALGSGPIDFRIAA